MTGTGSGSFKLRRFYVARLCAEPEVGNSPSSPSPRHYVVCGCWEATAIGVSSFGPGRTGLGRVWVGLAINASMIARPGWLGGD